MKEVESICSAPHYVINGHVQQGNIADVPWVGVHDTRINSSPRTGVYLAILFQVDGNSVAASIQHGSDRLGVRQLGEVTKSLRSDFQALNRTFRSDNLSLRPIDDAERKFARSSRPGKYEIASIVGKQWSMRSLSQDTLIDDLGSLLEVYSSWVGKTLQADDEETYQSIMLDDAASVDEMPGPRAERKNVRMGKHGPVRKLAEGIIAVKLAGFKCEYDEEHTTFFTKSGIMFMERHHLIPMEYYFDFDLSIDHHSNIFSLCPNCHRLIHHGADERRSEIIEQLFLSRKSIYQDLYGVSLNKILEYYSIQSR